MLTYWTCFFIGMGSSMIASIPIIASDLLNKKKIWETVNVFFVFGIVSSIILMFINWATKY